MCFFRSQAAVFEKMADGANFMVAAQRVVAALGNGKRHFLARKFHLQVIVLGFIACAAKTLKHVNNVAPMNVVRSWVREQLFQRLLSVRHGYGPGIFVHNKLQPIKKVDCTGLEPVTFSVSWRRASQLRQQSVNQTVYAILNYVFAVAKSCKQRSIRRNVLGFPRIASVSNMGGLTVEPVTPTRKG